MIEADTTTGCSNAKSRYRAEVMIGVKGNWEIVAVSALGLWKSEPIAFGSCTEAFRCLHMWVRGYKFAQDRSISSSIFNGEKSDLTSFLH